MTKSLPARCVALAVLAAAPAFGYVETELDRVTSPVGSRIAQRLALLAADGNRTVDEEREFRALAKVYTGISGPSEDLADELRELELAASGLRRVPDPSGTLAAALEDSVARAEELLALRRGYAEDHLPLLPFGRARREAAFLLSDAVRVEAKAASTVRPDRRAALLRRAEKLLTGALQLAEEGVLRADVERPPPRVRNGAVVGAAGGHIVIPDDGSPLAGIDVTLRPGAVGVARQLLVREALWTPEWPYELVAKPFEIRFPAADPTVAVPLTVSFPYDVAHAGDPTLAVGFPPGSIPGASFGADGRATVELPGFGFVIATRRLPPPPHPEFPAETYHVVLAFGKVTAEGSAVPSTTDGVVEQDFTFGPGPTGSTSEGTLDAVERRFVAASPRHEDVTRTAAVAGVPITWSLVANGPAYSPGRFTISFPLDGDTLNGTGDLSRDGAVVVFTARGANSVATGFGVRDDAGASAADLGKPWFVGAQTVRRDGSGSADFAEHRSVGVVRHVPDGAGGLVPDAGETLSAVSTRIRADVVPIGFSATTGTETMDALDAATLGDDGRLVAGGGRTTGWIHSAAGILVARRFDASGLTSSLLVGVRDDGGDFEDLFAPVVSPLVFPPYYSALTSAAGTRLVAPGTAYESVVTSWTSTSTSWARYTEGGPGALYPGLAGYGWTELHRAEMSLRRPADDGSWPSTRSVGYGWNGLHQWGNAFSTVGTGEPSPRRGPDPYYGNTLVASPDGEALLVRYGGGVGLGVRARE